MRIKFALLPLVLFTLNVHAASTKFEVDGTHSNVDFTIKHLMSQVRGSFSDFSGEFSFDEKKGADLKDVKFTIKAASVSTANAKRDEHLRSADFFEVEKFKDITFVGKKITSSGKNRFKVDGDLTLRGVTKPATFDIEYAGSTTHPFTGKPALGFTATTKLNRKDYGMIWNKALDKGGVMLGEEVTVQVNIEAGPAAAAK